MKQFNGYEAKKASYNTIPAGVYPIKIIDAVEVEYSSNYSALEIKFDISEGEYKYYYTNDFKNNTKDDKKYRGIVKVAIPASGSMYFDSNLKIFNNTMWAIEDSNKGYTWDWDERKLKGKEACVILRNEEFETTDGDVKMSVKPFRIESLKEFRAGKVKPAKDKLLSKREASSPSSASTKSSTIEEIEEIDVTDDDLPF